MAKYLYKYHEERGEFSAYVEDKNGKTIWEVNYPDFYEDEISGELIEGSTIFEDGFMKDANDIEGLEDYLKSMKLIESGDELVDEEEDLHEEEESRAEDFIEDVKEMHNAIAEIVLTDGTRIKGKDLMMEEGGSVEEGNNRMLMSNVKEIKHHAEELGDILKPNSRVDAWVVAKAERSASDLSDITHYMDSNEETFAKGGMTMGLSKEQTKRIAQKFADALSMRDKVDVSVNKYLEEDSFDLDYDGIEYAGGSYTILANGDVRNDALSNMPIYGNAKDSVQTIIKKIDHADSGYMAKGGFFEHGLEVGDKIISHKLKDDSIIVENHFRHERARVDLEKGKRSLIERNKLKYAKGGNVPSIEKKVAEVNELIREGNEKGVEVIDTSITWQSPMKYKPFKYSNGVLYEEYEELNLYSYNRGEGTKWETKKFKFKKNGSFGIDDQKDVLNQVARWYRKAIKHFDTYGYADGGMMAKGGKTKAINKRWNVVTKGHGGREVSGIITLGVDSNVSDVKRRMREMGYNSKSIISIESMEKGGVVYVDLFEDYENIPKKVGKILDRYYDRYGEDMDYEDTQNMLEEIEEVGYTFDYYLDNTPYGLRPIGVKLSQLKGYEDID